jgi:hypothetical protein
MHEDSLITASDSDQKFWQIIRNFMLAIIIIETATLLALLALKMSSELLTKRNPVDLPDNLRVWL